MLSGQEASVHLLLFTCSHVAVFTGLRGDLIRAEGAGVSRFAMPARGSREGDFQRLRFEIPLAGGDGRLCRRGGEPSRPGVRPCGRNEKVGEVCLARLRFTAQVESLLERRFQFF